MTDRLAEIEARVKAATPGPWHVMDKMSNPNPYPAVYATGEELHFIAMFNDRLYFNEPTDNQANAQLIAHAPTDLDFLLILAKLQQAVCDAAQSLCAGHRPGFIDHTLGIHHEATLRDALKALDAWVASQEGKT